MKSPCWIENVVAPAFVVSDVDDDDEDDNVKEERL